MQLTPDEIEAERTRFEAWWRSRYNYLQTLRFDRDGDEYVMPGTQFAFIGFLGGVASERDHRKQEQEAEEAEVDRLGRWWPSGERAE